MIIELTNAFNTARKLIDVSTELRYMERRVAELQGKLTELGKVPGAAALQGICGMPDSAINSLSPEGQELLFRVAAELGDKCIGCNGEVCGKWYERRGAGLFAKIIPEHLHKSIWAKYVEYHGGERRDCGDFGCASTGNFLHWLIEAIVETQ